MHFFWATNMNEAKLSTAQEADLEHLKEYLNSIATVTEIAIEAGADLSLYNSLCAGLKLRVRGESSLSLVD
jgi:hypothetical protein